MNEARKIEAILNAWFDYINLDDCSSARVEVAKQEIVKQSDVTLRGNQVLIEEAIFSELHKELTSRKQGQQEAVWALSFPQVIDIDNKKSYLCPLFSLDVTSILQGDYQEQGWDLDSLTLTEAGGNLATFLRLDDEQREQLITKDGLRPFLENKTIFGIEFETYEQWMRQVRIPARSRCRIQPQPYLFKFRPAIYSINLKRDLQEIKSGSKNWSKGDPAYEYLFGVPQDRKHEVIYMGAFPTHPPTNSQLVALKHAKTEPLTAVQGPPGSGKTTLILHLIAQQVVKRALAIIEAEENTNNLTVVSSTNNKAVENVIERLDEWLNDGSLEHNFLYIKGGSRPTIESPGAALDQLEYASEYLENYSFNESRYNSLKESIKQIKDEFIAEESNYLEQRRKRAIDEERLPELQDKIQNLQQHLDEILAARTNFQGRTVDLAEYEQLPIEAYRKIDFRFTNAERLLPEGRLPWLIRLWRWITRKTEKNIITKAVLACESAIESTLNTPFDVKNPTTRTELVQEAQLVRERLDKGEELKRVQARLQEIDEDIEITETKNNQASEELRALENRLANPLEDFYTTFQEKFHEQHKELFKLSRELLIQQALQDRDDVKNTLEVYSSFLSKDWKSKSEIANNLDKHIKNLSLIFPVITSTLTSIRNMLPRVSECVDRTIVDEAGMIPLHQTFPLLVRSRKAIIVGDPLQLEPVITLTDQRRHDYRQIAFLDKGLTEIDYHRYSPEEKYRATTYHRAAGASGEDNDQGQGICLKEHYRCQRSIIEYCDDIAGYGLEVKTAPVDSLLESNLVAYHVEGTISKNVNQEEVTAVLEIIEHLLKQDYSLEDIGVISPFRAQADALEKEIKEKFPQFKEKSEKSVGTIHKFQGSEKRVIILSTKVCQPQDKKRINWINKRPNMLNVAVSRAKEVFILVGNLYRLKKGRLTGKLVKHIRDNGVILEYKTEEEIPQPQPGATMVYDCEHITVFSEALDHAEEELIIVTPWIRPPESRQFEKDVVSVLKKGVKVTVIYGKQDRARGENDDNNSLIEKSLRKLIDEYSDLHLIRLGEGAYIESEGTNERILVCDTQFAIVGSWNWLSHPYRRQCNRSLINPKVQIRRETSIKVSELSSIEDIKNSRIYQLLRS
ncbi:AAA domain-containing protein [Moorena sp. SIO3H5]|uniref:AAA domain-containing protein n=1 Tax=Moorena sp. SIO3H5 TaxID=2607834 RepID=UPI0013BA71FB|nr:AAA domain-containing protein [Moorena sp. SIO3H5]NEO71917.1 DNA/RNA helicase [Moorena sp. SIO3H5]